MVEVVLPRLIRWQQLHGSRDATDYGHRPVTCNTCNNGGFLPFYPLQVGRISVKTGCNPVFNGESHAVY